MLNPFSKYKREKKPTPSWVTWLMIGVVMYALLANQHNGSEVRKATEYATDKIDPNKTLLTQDFKKKLVPSFSPALKLLDIKTGTGMPAVCGQEVSVAYEAIAEGGKLIDDGATADKPLHFTIGAGKILPALEQGVIGMQPGGKRSAIAPPGMAYGLPEFSREGAPADAAVKFDIDLLKAEPPLPDTALNPFRIAETFAGNGPAIVCGQPIALNVTMWDTQGKKLFSSKDGDGPVRFTLGKSEVFLGLEQGAIGMSAGGTRMLVVPPAFLKTMNGSEPAIAFTLPDKQTVLVEIEALP